MNNYIPFPSTMRNQERTLRLRMREGEAGYGIYVMVLEMLRESKNYELSYDTEQIAWALHIQDIERLKRVLENYDLFSISSEKKLTSPWLIEAMKPLEDKRLINAERAKKAAEARWGQAMPEQCTSNAQASNTDATRTDFNANYIYKINKINQINQTRSAWEVADGKIIPFEKIDTVCRCTDRSISDEDRQYAVKKTNEEHNMRCIVEIAEYFGLNYTQYKLLLEITQSGLVGGKETKELLQTYNRCKQENYKARFPMNYIMSNFSGYKYAREKK